MNRLEEGRLESVERQTSGGYISDNGRTEDETLFATAVFSIDQLVEGLFNLEPPEDEEDIDLANFRQEYGGTVRKSVGEKYCTAVYEESHGRLYAVKTDPGEVAFIWNGDERQDLFQDESSTHPDIYKLPEVSGQEWENLGMEYDEDLSVPGDHDENLEMSKPESGSVMSEESRWGLITGSIEPLAEINKHYREFLRANG